MKFPTVMGSLALATATIATPAYAAFPQQTCGTGWSDNIPVDIGSHEFDIDLNTGNYGLNEWFIYPLDVNSNVAWMNPHLLNWNTETNADILTLDGGDANYQFSDRSAPRGGASGMATMPARNTRSSGTRTGRPPCPVAARSGTSCASSARMPLRPPWLPADS